MATKPQTHPSTPRRASKLTVRSALKAGARPMMQRSSIVYHRPNYQPVEISDVE
jgi:hypothetical protein